MSNKTNWAHRLNAIDCIKQAGLLDWQLINTGSSNNNIKTETKQGTWMIRFNRASLGINRFEEERILELIQPLSVAPEVIENNPKEGYLITQYINHPNWQQQHLKDPNFIKALKIRLQEIHNIRYEYLPSRLDNRLKTYLNNFNNVKNSIAMELLENIQKLDNLGFWQDNNSLYHSDLNMNNLLGTKPLYIIDWEYAGQGHPLLDWLILEFESNLDLSEHYPSDINPEWIKPAKKLVTIMMDLWPQESP